MGAEAIIFFIILGAFAAFILFVGFVDIIANEKAITFEQEKALRVQPVPVKARAADHKPQVEFNQAA